MIAILRAALLRAMAVSCMPAVAAGQQPSVDSLLRRIDSLEQRVRALESRTKVEPLRDQPVPDASKWQDLANWRRLRIGMKMDEVRALLGEPETVDANPVTITWHYPGGPQVSFASLSGKVEGWREPLR